MRLHYRYAVISFNADLTDPKAKPCPVAVVGSGEWKRDTGIVFIISTDQPVRNPIESAMLGRLPRFLQEEIDAFLVKEGSELAGLIEWLSQRIGHNFALSETRDRKVEVRPEHVVNRTLQLFVGNVTDERAHQGIRRKVPSSYIVERVAPPPQALAAAPC